MRGKVLIYNSKQANGKYSEGQTYWTCITQLHVLEQENLNQTQDQC